MPTQVWTFRRFFFSEYFADGVRVTFALLLPTLLLSLLGHLQAGIPLAMGALLVSLSDAPGPATHKRNGMLVCILTVWLVALTTGFARLSSLAMGAEILVFSFLFSMLTVYGNRAALIGSGALLAMILVMGLHPENVWGFAFLVAAGGLWYFLLSMLFLRLLPYRPAQHALGECIRETAAFLKLRAAFYSLSTDPDTNYRKIVQQQVVVSEKQDAVRELLLRSRQLVKEATDQSRRLVLAFVDVVDLYEQISVMQNDYNALRDTLSKLGLLDHIGLLIRHMAEELNEMGWAVQSIAPYKPTHALETELANLRERVQQTPEAALAAQSPVLQGILVNMERILEKYAHIRHYFGPSTGESAGLGQEEDYARFVSHEEYSASKLVNNLTWQSSIFKYSLRVALACFVGFMLMQTVIEGSHSYWVLLTILVILKPAFSLTKQRNFQRLLGTIIGGLVGVVVLALVQDEVLRFMILIIAMVGTFSLIRLNYIVSVIFMTPFVLIVFSFLGGAGTNIAQERIIDTLIGSAVAFAASYLLFPNWESAKLSLLLRAILKANIAYLQRLSLTLAGKDVASIEYKLARKEVYVSAANLSAAFQRMISEPKSKQRNVEAIYNFLVLNHILSSNIASVASLLQAGRQQTATAGHLQEAVNQAVDLLQRSLRQIEESPAVAEAALPQLNAEPQTGQERSLLQEQLVFLQKVSQDIYRTTGAIVV
ncbi:FUSC family protein [Pontibacter akesuensis]|uniref:Uncharacterized membrane protein YccC n=1 Tax=Pontibacter akesuensis TaxID=388950 RepID=A0A1I7FIC1_9BACT|nr:FUSC family membrane protein [Pontibacter akesuensis]GHA62035.1 hypothetical protein GCM10007389_13330 [Pontibacter akesuensis]SFU35943.1 Uncharacterized membrane protein YccC [Pontibacter akesuensis]